MAITNLPTFEDDEILSASKLNELRDAIETKFSGAISGSDISWPLVAQGNLDMSGYSILGVKTFWNIINADEYTTFQAAIDAAEAAGGGAVVIPPNTTIEAQGLTIDVGNIAIIGYGEASVLKLPDAPASDMITTQASLTGLRFEHVRFDGNTGAGTNLNCLSLVNAIDCKVLNCSFDDWSGSCIDMQDDLGAACDDVEILGCDFVGGDGDLVKAQGLISCHISNCDFESSTATGGINIIPSAGAQAERITISGNHITVSGDGIRMVSNGGTDYGDCIITSNYVKVTGTTKSGIVCGEAGVPMQNCLIADNIIEAATEHGIEGNGPGMVVNGNIVRNCTGDGISMVSDDMTMHGNVCKANGGNGITIANCSEITVANNMCVDNTSNGYDFTNIDFGFFTGNGAGDNGSVRSFSGLTNCTSGAGNAWLGITPSFLYDEALSLGGSLSFGNNSLVGANNGNNPSDGFETTPGGSGLVHRAKIEVLQTASSPTTLWTVPVGEIWMVHRAYVRTSTAWDGAGTDLDIGISGGDVDGYIDGSAITGFPETAQIYCEDVNEQGALLYSSRAISNAIDATGGAVDIIATVTAGGGTTGVSDVFLEYSVIEAD